MPCPGGRGCALGSGRLTCHPRAWRLQNMKKRSMLLALAAVVLVLLIIGLCIWLPEASKQHSHVYPRAAVAADAKRCSEIGR